MKLSLQSWIAKLNYVLFVFILAAVVLSFIITIMAFSQYHNVKTYNTWQFPMLLALFADQFVYLFL